MKTNLFLEKFDLVLRSVDSVSKLRQAILELAIQGNLSAKWRDENPELVSGENHALKTLEKIKAEKEEWIRKGEIKKNKLPSQITNKEKPFILPEGWAWCRLEDIVSRLGDGLHGTPKYLENGNCYFINGNNLDEGKILIKGQTKRVSLEEYNKHKKELTEKTILISINGTLGNYAFYNDEKVILGKSACYFNLLNNVNKLYIKNVIKTDYFLRYASDKSSRTTIKNLSLKGMRMFLVPLPPLAEQEQIVFEIDQLMLLCDELEAKQKKQAQTRRQLNDTALNALLSVASPEEFENHWQRIVDNFDLLYDDLENLYALRQGILQLAIQGKLTKKQKKDPRRNLTSASLITIPDSWTLCKLQDVATLKSGNQYKYKNVQSGVMYVKVGDMNLVGNESEIKTSTNYYDSQEVNENNLIPVRSIIFPKRGGAIATNKRRIVQKEPILIDSNTMAAIVNENINFKYFLLWFNTIDLSEIGSDGTIPQVNNKDLYPLPFPLPPLDEQAEIVQKVDQLVALCDELEKKLDAKLSHLKKLTESLLRIN